MNPHTPAEEMKREQVIDALRHHAHPLWFHSLLKWSTPQLKALLVFYRESDKEGAPSPDARTSPRSAMFSSLDRGLPGAELSIVSIIEVRPRRKIGETVN